MNNKCPICEADGWITDGKSKVCNECEHYDESYHHGHEAKRREQEARRMEQERIRQFKRNRW